MISVRHRQILTWRTSFLALVGCPEEVLPGHLPVPGQALDNFSLNFTSPGNILRCSFNNRPDILWILIKDVVWEPSDMWLEAKIFPDVWKMYPSLQNYADAWCSKISSGNLWKSDWGFTVRQKCLQICARCHRVQRTQPKPGIEIYPLVIFGKCDSGIRKQYSAQHTNMFEENQGSVFCNFTLKINIFSVFLQKTVKLSATLKFMCG